MVGGFTRRLQLSSTIAWLCGVVRGSLHRLFELDIRLSTGKNLAHLGDVVLQEMLLQGVSNLQPANVCDGSNFLPTVGDFGELILEEIEVRLEIVSLPHFDREEVVVVPLSLLVGGLNASVILAKLWSEWGNSE